VSSPSTNFATSALTEYYRTSYYMKRIEGQPLSPYIIHCCKVLGDAREHESDLTLVAMIRLYGFVEQVISSVTNRLNATEISAPVWMQIAGLRKDLHTYWATLPPQIKNDRSYPFSFLYPPRANSSILQH
jgi:hypothetical protein